MLPRLSVKKPYTILVAVVLVLVLGVVSFTGMTTDLLPNIELPYVVVVTAYPGRQPRKGRAGGDPAAGIGAGHHQRPVPCQLGLTGKLQHDHPGV